MDRYAHGFKTIHRRGHLGLRSTPKSLRTLVAVAVICSLIILGGSRRSSGVKKQQASHSLRRSLPEVTHTAAAANTSCAQQAAHTRPSDSSIASLAHRSRDLPSVNAGSLVLAASNWEGVANKEHAELTRAQLIEACGGHIFRYRIVNRVVYADHNHTGTDALKGHRDTFLEQLLMAVWLYRTFPDVDLWVSFADEPSRCTLDVPVLQYTVIGLNATRQAASSNMVSDYGSYFSMTQLLTGGGTEPADPTAPAPKFYHGWAFNYPFSWEQLSYLPDVLHLYQQCLLSKVGGQPSKPQLIWRGGNTGSRRGWAPLTGPQVQPLQHPWGVALTNKRMALALLARSYPDWMDVGLHEVLPHLMGQEGSDPHLVQDLKNLLIRPYVPLEVWGQYALQLSVDGHGSPNRLPLQYLQGSSVILKVMSPYKDSFEELFKPGVDYEPVKYDLSDLVPRAQGLLKGFNDSSIARLRMREMAARAGAKAVKTFSILGQLDALMYAILKVKSACRWEVQVPPLRSSPAATAGVAGTSAEREWEVLVLSRNETGSDWKSPSLRAPWAAGIRSSLQGNMTRNFELKRSWLELEGAAQ